MFNQLLVTPSLLDSFDFYKNAPATWKSRAEASFISQIKREPVDYPKWVQAGNDFESCVQSVCNPYSTKEQALRNGSDNFKKVVSICHGGKFQQVLKAVRRIDDQDVCFYGRSDVEKPYTTIDLKTTPLYKGEDKYLNKSQHKFYLALNGKKYFKYVVVEWEDDSYIKIASVYEIDYTSPGKEHLLKELDKKVCALFEGIRTMDLWDDYYFTFSKN